ncbi:cytochrome P460 family protein [Sinimarinibacterium thermocellulolyticum]
MAADNAVPYPDGYRNWRHVKSLVIQPGHALYDAFGGIHHLYANDKALQGYKTGKFPNGSVIVFDLLDASAADHAITEGARKVIGVMHKDAKTFAATEGWGFEGFGGGDRDKRVVGENAATACFACHAAQKDHDYVFSVTRD